MTAESNQEVSYDNFMKSNRDIEGGSNNPSTSRPNSLSRRSASTTEERRNPFAKREGNALIWSGVNMTLNTKQGEKKILHDVWGEIPPGEITAIMGPSGK